jgi:carbamoyl-phosphate synthase large subunit
LWYVADALGSGLSVDEVSQLTNIDPWFVDQILSIIEQEEQLKAWRRRDGDWTTAEGRQMAWQCKRVGLSDAEIGRVLGRSERDDAGAAGPGHSGL